jgi:eukaryotic-like serine/threonine-protein kinase
VKLNCWEFHRCGREPGGIRSLELGVCPAATHNAFAGENEGKFAGRCCWLIAGTYCEGRIQGSFAQKLKDCTRCAFYHLVRLDESRDFANWKSEKTGNGP